jgi:hypothetical protein
MSLLPILKSDEPYQNLLDAAEAAHGQGQYKEAVILAQTAVELFTEKALGQLYVARHVEFLKDPFEHLLINYNIGNTKVSRLYVALSEDNIHTAPFWSNFVAHTELRNALVHEGKDASVTQSRASLDAVSALMEHISATLKAV